MTKFKKTEDVIIEFKLNNKDRVCETKDPEIMYINPQRIIAINENFNYEEIMKDDKMKKLKESYDKHGWIDTNIQSILSFTLLMLPNGDILANGGGNHRSVLSKELGLTSVRAYVAKVVYK